MSLLRQGKAQALTIYLGESDQWQGQSLSVVLIELLRKQGCAGATITRAITGYGAGARLHEQRGWRWSSDAPLIIQVIDQPERIRRVLPQIQECLDGGLITLHEVEVHKYTHARTHGLPTKLPVAQVMETAVSAVTLDTPVASVITLLLQARFRALPVVDEQQRLQGIISTGDLIEANLLPVRRGVMRAAQGLDQLTAETIAAPLQQARDSTLTARAVMNRQVSTVRPESSIREAAQVMIETGRKRLPVVGDDGTLRGMLSRSDLLQMVVTSPLMSAEPGSSERTANSSQGLGSNRPVTGPLSQQQPVAAYMERDVTALDEQAPLAEVIDALLLSPLKRVIVVDAQKRVQGIISDVDVLGRIGQEERPRILRLLGRWTQGVSRPLTGALSSGKARVAADLMNREVVTVTETTSVQAAIECMITTQRKILPVVDEQNHLKGVVGRSDLLRILLEDNA